MDDAKGERDLRRRRVATGAVLLALIVAAFEGTVVTAAMPTVTAELGGRALYGWVFSAFLVATAIGVLVCGKLADGYGRRPVFTIGSGLFILGSMLCGFAPGVTWLIVFRILQGLGAGAIQPMAMTIVGDLYTLEERAKIQGVLTATWGAANVSGPIIGGAIVEAWSWRGVFFVNVPFAVLAVIVLLVSYRDPPRTKAGAPGIDGAIFTGLACALVLLALEPRVPFHLAFALASAFAVAGVVVQQRRTAHPILPRALFRDRVILAGFAGGAIAGGILYTCAAFVPLWVAQRSSQPIFAGVPLIFLLGGWAFGSTFGVHVLVKRGMKTSVAGGYALALAGAVALAWVVRSELSLGPAFAALALLGLGLGPAASTSLVAPQNHVGWKQRGAITSAMYAARTLGGSLAIALLGAVAGERLPGVFTGVAIFAAVGLVAALALAPSSSGAREGGTGPLAS